MPNGILRTRYALDKYGNRRALCAACGVRLASRMGEFCCSDRFCFACSTERCQRTYAGVYNPKGAEKSIEAELVLNAAE